jgi:hypothetical protein
MSSVGRGLLKIKLEATAQLHQYLVASPGEQVSIGCWDLTGLTVGATAVPGHLPVADGEAQAARL